MFIYEVHVYQHVCTLRTSPLFVGTVQGETAESLIYQLHKINGVFIMLLGKSANIQNLTFLFNYLACRCISQGYLQVYLQVLVFVIIYSGLL